MTRALAEEVATWRYAPPDDVHDSSDATVGAMLDGEHVAVLEGETLVAFCGAGADGQVPGGPGGDDATDVSIGVRPDRMGEGLGSRALSLLIESLRMGGHQQLRASVLEANLRSRSLMLRCGFHESSRFARDDDGVPFVVYELDISV
jgi:L-amino acid N-acyltransferase YncA